jgi:nitrite reductase/ring-hydroxylating ferredoxin subunit
MPDEVTPGEADAPGDWLEVGPVDEVERRRKLVVEDGERLIAVFWHEGEVYALANTCIHKQRELEKGVILNGRIVCPGHQWAFELASGWCRERERCQPTFAIEVRDATVYVHTGARVLSEAPDAH